VGLTTLHRKKINLLRKSLKSLGPGRILWPEGRWPLGRPRRWWLDNIRMDLLELGWGDVDWIGLAQDRDRWRALVNSVLSLRVP
jgi:hypothetical protein